MAFACQADGLRREVNTVCIAAVGEKISNLFPRSAANNYNTPIELIELRFDLGFEHLPETFMEASGLLDIVTVHALEGLLATDGPVVEFGHVTTLPTLFLIGHCHSRQTLALFFAKIPVPESGKRTVSR